MGWEDIREFPAGTKVIQTIEDDALPGGLRSKEMTYTAPFDRCDRETDYREAWRAFWATTLEAWKPTSKRITVDHLQILGGIQL